MSKWWCVVVTVLWTVMILSHPIQVLCSESIVVNPDQSGSSDSKLKDEGVNKSLLSSSSGEKSDGIQVDTINPLNSDNEGEKVNREKRGDKSRSDDVTVKVKLSDGSYLYRQVSIPDSVAPGPTVARVTRGYSNKKGAGRSKGGYGYKKKSGYVYTTPSTTTTTTTTRLPPIAESIIENDSVGINPDPPTPLDSTAGRDFITTPLPTDDPWDIRNSIPGEPGQDYKVYGSIPETNFSCEGRTPGFYADTETGCQVFHRCSDDPWYTGQVRVTMDSFLCPNGSLFNQQIYTCDWWGNVNCDTAKDFYQLNEQIGQLEETNVGTVQYVQFTGVRVPPPPGQKRKAPRIIPKSQRKPLPPEYKSKHRYVDDGSGNPRYPEDGIDIRNGGTRNFDGVGGEDVETDDDLIRNFEQGNEGARGFSVDRNNNDDNNSSKESGEDEERDGSSQNREEVSVRPPKKLKAKTTGGGRRKKSKTTTTTTTPSPPENDDEEDESEETSEEGDEGNNNNEEDEEETPAATNNQAGPLIVNRPGENEEAEQQVTEEQRIIPPTTLEPPPQSGFQGEPVQQEEENRFSPGGDNEAQGTYIPPTKETSGGYSYPKPKGYLPPSNKSGKDGYLPPPEEKSGYLPPKKKEEESSAGYLSGASPPTLTYIPPSSAPNPTVTSYHTTPLHTYSSSPDSYYRKPSSGYGAPVTSFYAPPTAPSYYNPPSSSPIPQQYLPQQQPSGQQYGLPGGPSSDAQQRPSGQYGPPQQTPGQYGPTQQTPGQYGPPQQTPGQYGPPQQTPGQYGPPPQPIGQYGPPPQHSAQYGPPTQTQGQYGPPPPAPQPTGQYGPPPSQTQSSQYGPPPPPQTAPQYGPPSPPKPTGQYGPPPPPQTAPQYGPPPPKQQPPQYLPPPSFPSQAAGNQYLPPRKPQGYLPPQQSNDNKYLPPPKESSKDYLPPQQQQQQQYLPPQQTNSHPAIPSSQQNPNQYIPPPPPQQQYNIPPPSQTSSNGGYNNNVPPQGQHYGIPSSAPAQKPQHQYLPPQQQPGQYLPPRQNKNADGYLPPKTSNAYLPPNKEYLPVPVKSFFPSPLQGYSTINYRPSNSNDYLTPTQKPPPNEYLPPPNNNNNNNQQQQYLPAPPPSQQSNQQQQQYLPPKQSSESYLPPPQQNNNNQYLPPQKEVNNQYLPPKQEDGYINPPATPTVVVPTAVTYVTTTEHWPAKYAYEAPTIPSTSVEYTVSSTYGTPYHHNNYNQMGYTTLNGGLVSPTSAYNPNQYSSFNQYQNHHHQQQHHHQYSHNSNTNQQQEQLHQQYSHSHYNRNLQQQQQQYLTHYQNQQYSNHYTSNAGSSNNHQSHSPSPQLPLSNGQSQRNNVNVVDSYSVPPRVPSRSQELPVPVPTSNSQYSTIPIQTPPPRDEIPEAASTNLPLATVSRPPPNNSNIDFVAAIPGVSYTEVINSSKR